MIDFTSVAVAAVGAVMSVIGSLFLAWLRSHMKDQAAAVTIETAVNNALGATQQALVAGITSHPLQATIPGINPATAAGVQYVLDNAGPELARYADITPATLASKIEAKMGLVKLAAATPSPAVVAAVAAAAPVAAP